LTGAIRHVVGLAETHCVKGRLAYMPGFTGRLLFCQKKMKGRSPGRIFSAEATRWA